MYNIQTKILTLLFKINSHKKKYFDDFLNGYSLAVTFADWLTGLVFHTVTKTFIALVSPGVQRNKVCIREYTSTAFSTTTISRNFSARFLWFKQLIWTSNDFYISLWTKRCAAFGHTVWGCYYINFGWEIDLHGTSMGPNPEGFGSNLSRNISPNATKFFTHVLTYVF